MAGVEQLAKMATYMALLQSSMEEIRDSCLEQAEHPTPQIDPSVQRASFVLEIRGEEVDS